VRTVAWMAASAAMTIGRRLPSPSEAGALLHQFLKRFEAGAVGFARMFLGELFELALLAGFFKA
jgi:hypothetical protein